MRCLHFYIYLIVMVILGICNMNTKKRVKADMTR